MACIEYLEKSFRGDSPELLAHAQEIVAEYMRDGYELTLRQLYYQFVARDLMPNCQASYNKLGNLISNARLGGHLDWDAIVDRTRQLQALPTWDSPENIVEECAKQYRIDLWENQPAYVEVWVEKDALGSVIERACEPFRVPFLSCRGYVSLSEMHNSALRFEQQANYGKQCLLIHLGDHDPSGIDMTRDIQDRCDIFHYGANQVEVLRIALNMDQIEEHNPPPNFAKMSDSRAGDYVPKYGNKSWELDALDPSTLVDLITCHIENAIDHDYWETALAKEKDQREQLMKISKNLGK